MLLSKTGDKASLQSLEAIKWLGAACMLAQHVPQFVLGHAPPLALFVGTFAFPLFAIALSVGSSVSYDVRRICTRLWLWAVISEIVGSPIRDAVPVNVLFTLALGCTSWLVAQRPRGLMFAPLIFVASLVVEFGPYGVFMVACLFWWARENDSRTASTLFVVAALCCVLGNEGVWFGVFAFPVAYCMLRVDLSLPRAGRAFYWIYAGQWPLLSVARGFA